jgi:hypothetical protein
VSHSPRIPGHISHYGKTQIRSKEKIAKSENAHSIQDVSTEQCRLIQRTGWTRWRCAIIIESTRIHADSRRRLPEPEGDPPEMSIFGQSQGDCLADILCFQDRAHWSPEAVILLYSNRVEHSKKHDDPERLIVLVLKAQSREAGMRVSV